MKLGILQCGHTPDPVADKHGDFDKMFTRLLAPHGFSFQTWSVVDGDFPSDCNQAEVWLITGSKHGAYEDYAFIKPLEALIRDIHANSKRMVGICFGHQIIAQALGGRVEKHPGGWAIGRTGYDMSPLGKVHLNAWHQDQVVERPEGAQILGSNAFCKHAALVYGDTILTVQPHPELSPAIIADYIKARSDDPTYPASLMARARAENSKPTDDVAVAALLSDFLKTGREALTT